MILIGKIGLGFFLFCMVELMNRSLFERSTQNFNGEKNEPVAVQVLSGQVIVSLLAGLRSKTGAWR